MLKQHLKRRVRQVLNSFRQPPKFVYADAGYDPKTGKGVIAYAVSDLTSTGYEFIKAASINEAELRAVKIALEKYPGLRVATDSMYAVAHSDPEDVYYIPRRQNLANLIVRSAMEMARSKVEHKPS